MEKVTKMIHKRSWRNTRVPLYGAYVYIYSEKQLKDIKILLTIKQLRKYFPCKAFSYLIELPICNLAECKIQLTSHWLRFSTTPNVPTLFTQSSQAKKNSVYIFCCNPYLVITYVLILTTDKCSYPFISNCT